MSLIRRQARGQRVTIHVPGITTMPAVVIESVDGASEIALSPKRTIGARFLHRQPAVLIPDEQGAPQVDGLLLAYEDERGGLREDRMQLLHRPADALPSLGRDQAIVANPLYEVDRAAVPLSRLDEDLAEQIVESGTVQYLLDDQPGTKRRAVRIQVVRPAALIPDGFRSGWLNGTVRDVSVGGLLVSGAERMRAGERLRVRFELAHEDDWIDIHGRIVRDRDPWGLRGVRIDRIGAAERERLVRFIFATQRQSQSARLAARAPR